jgi:hypothetical protein
MNLARLRVVAADEFWLTLRRPMVWVLIALLLFLSYGLSAGWVSIGIASGDASVGGTRPSSRQVRAHPDHRRLQLVGLHLLCIRGRRLSVIRGERSACSNPAVHAAQATGGGWGRL